MRRVVQTFTEDEGGRPAAIREMLAQARRITEMGLSDRYGVYVDKSIRRGDRRRRWAPWAVWIVDRYSTLNNPDLTGSKEGVL